MKNSMDQPRTTTAPHDDAVLNDVLIQDLAHCIENAWEEGGVTPFHSDEPSTPVEGHDAERDGFEMTEGLYAAMVVFTLVFDYGYDFDFACDYATELRRNFGVARHIGVNPAGLAGFINTKLREA